MRNAILQSSPSLLYNFGSNEVHQMPNLDVSMPVDSIITSVYGNGFSMESKVFNNDNQITGGGYTIPSQSFVNYAQGYQSSTCNGDNISQQSMLFSQKRSPTQYEKALQCPIEVNALLAHQKGIGELVDSPKNECKKKSKKQKVVNSSSEEEQWLHLKEVSRQIQELRCHVPIKKSLKLSDKITALQKLVSPYGKTDTASVLQEASLYIKLLQDHIKNLFQMLNSSYNSVSALNPQEIAFNQLDLRNRGLCLVPISFMQRATKEDVDPHI